mgnify:FL=1
MKENASAPVAFIVKGYPRLSETFIAQEIESLEQRGLEIRVISLRHPSDSTIHPVHRRISASVNYLPEYLYQEPMRVWRAWLRVRGMPGFDGARRQWLADLRRDPTPNRVRRFGQAMVLAAELGADVSHLHAHFLHTPASVARYAAHLTGRSWSCSAHAKDIWTTPEWEKREKLADVSWVTTCSQVARDHLAILAPLENAEGTVILAYHGIDLEQFPPPQSAIGRRNGADVEDPVRILSVGRAVAKKGYDDLVASLAMLPGSIHWRLDHIGGGALLEQLKDQAAKAGITDRITWHGAQPQAIVLEAMGQSDVFVLASRIAPDGDRDGLPNVLMEANSQGLACIATNVSAIPELIIHDETGLLVEPDDRLGLSSALISLIGDPTRRHELGQAGQSRVQQEFSHDQCIERVAGKFGLPAQAADADVKVVRKA